MLFEQPAELNKYDYTPPTWAARWQMLLLFAPILILLWGLFVETAVCEVWLNGANLMQRLPWIIVASTILWFVLIPFAFELQLRLDQRSKHTLQIDDVGFRISANKFRSFAWKRLLAWHLEPVGGNTDMCKLKMEFSHLGKNKRSNRWSIILRDQNQTALLKSELERIRRNGTHLPPLIELHAPSPKKPLPRPASLWLFTISFYLFFHAPLLLIPGIMLSFSGIFHTSNSTSKLAVDNLGRLVAHYFSGAEQYRNFLLISGGCLMALAAACYMWAKRISKASKLNQGRATNKRDE